MFHNHDGKNSFSTTLDTIVSVDIARRQKDYRPCASISRFCPGSFWMGEEGPVDTVFDRDVDEKG